MHRNDFEHYELVTVWVSIRARNCIHTSSRLLDFVLPVKNSMKVFCLDCCLDDFLMGESWHKHIQQLLRSGKLVKTHPSIPHKHHITYMYWIQILVNFYKCLGTVLAFTFATVAWANVSINAAWRDSCFSSKSMFGWSESNEKPHTNPNSSLREAHCWAINASKLFSKFDSSSPCFADRKQAVTNQSKVKV